MQYKTKTHKIQTRKHKRIKNLENERDEGGMKVDSVRGAAAFPFPSSWRCHCWWCRQGKEYIWEKRYTRK